MDITVYKESNSFISTEDQPELSSNKSKFEETLCKKMGELKILAADNTEESVRKFCDICRNFGLTVIGKQFRELPSNHLLHEYLLFLCEALRFTSSLEIADVILFLIPKFISTNTHFVTDFEQNNIHIILLEKLQQANIHDPSHSDLIKRILSVTAELIKNTMSISNYEFIMNYTNLQELLSIDQDYLPYILLLSSSIIEFSPPHYEFRDIFFSLANQCFNRQLQESTYFIKALRKRFKRNHSHLNDESYQEDSRMVFDLIIESENESPCFLAKFSPLIIDDSLFQVKEILLLFCTIIKSVNQRNIFSIFAEVNNFKDEILAIVRHYASLDRETIDETYFPELIPIVYKIITFIVQTNAQYIQLLFEDDIMIGQLIAVELESGFRNRKNALRLLNSLMKFGSFIPDTEGFYSPPFISLVSTMLSTCDNKIIIEALITLNMIITKAKNEENQEIFNAIQQFQVIETLEDIRTLENIDNEKVEFLLGIIHEMIQE